MIVGYVLVGSFAGALVSVVALLLGASLWLAFGLYALVGSAVVIIVPTARMLTGDLAFLARVTASEHPLQNRPDNLSDPAGALRRPDPTALKPLGQSRQV